MKLNENELLVGFLVGSTSALLMDWWFVPMSISVSVLWALGGTYHKAYRRVGVPLVITICYLIFYEELLCLLTFPMLFGVLSIGYGIPTIHGQKIVDGDWVYEYTDEGSFLGSFFWKYSLNDKLANFLTRGTIYLLILVSLITPFVIRRFM